MPVRKALLPTRIWAFKRARDGGKPGYNAEDSTVVMDTLWWVAALPVEGTGFV
jgi:hypothetical protein